MTPEPDSIERFHRLEHGGEIRYARRDGDGYALWDGPPWRQGRATGERAPAAAALRCPVEPGKIVCVGLNYLLHLAESASRDTVPDEPILFLKPPSALIGPGEAIVLPRRSSRVDHEAEVALVIGRRLRRAGDDEARAAVFGVTALNDVTARDLQKLDVQWTRAKGFDSFCPVGPCVARGAAWDDLAVSARVNGETRQSGRTRDWLVGGAALLAYISQAMTLEPGDVVATGTPAGVGPLRAGDFVEIEVEGVGVLGNPVVAE